MKKIIISLVMLFTLTGCESQGKVHDKNYLRAAEFDGDRLTMKFFGEDEESVTVDCESIEVAQKLAELKTGKEIFTGYTELIVLKDCNNLEVLDYMLNGWKVSPDCMIAFAGESELLKDASAEKLEGSVKAAQRQGIAPECDIITVLGELLTEGGTAEIPEINSSGFRKIYSLKI